MNTGVGRALVVSWREMDRWVVPSGVILSRQLPTGWTRPRVGELVRLVSKPARVEPDREYKMAGVKWYGEGVFHRETVKGKELSARWLTPLGPGSLIYNRLFAWKAAFAVVPLELADCFVSNEFPQFVPDTSRILPEYLYLWCISARTIKAVNAASTGSAAISRNRFGEEFFLDFEIPVPPLDTQRKVVAVHELARQKVHEASKRLTSLVHDLDTELRQSARMNVLHKPWLVSRWKDLISLDMKSARATTFRLNNPNFRPLGEFAEEATYLVKPWEAPKDNWPVYGVNNKDGVFFSHFQPGNAFNAPYKRIRKEWFFHNPTRSNVGSLGMVPEVPENSITSPEYQVWRIKSGLLPGFVATLIATQFFIDLIQVHRVGAVKQRLYVENLLQIPIPVVPHEVQRKIANCRELAMQEIGEARAAADVAKTEIEAMILGST